VGQRYRTAGRLRVRAAGKLGNTGKVREQEQSRDRLRKKNAGRLDETKRTGNKYTENTGINTQGIMGKMGDTWRGWRQSQRQVKQCYFIVLMSSPLFYNVENSKK
jgi:hypothetical protein